MKKLITSLLLTLSLTACSTNSHLNPHLGSYLDAGTTYHALEHTNAIELNPLLSSGSPAVAALGTIALKAGGKYALSEWAGVPYDVSETSMETAGVFAGMSNLSLIMGLNPAVGIAVGGVSGIIYWNEMMNE